MDGKSILLDRKKIKKTEINNLAEYIQLISDQKGKYKYFRGESNRYKTLNGSAFRPYGGSDSKIKEYPFLEMMKEFKRAVWNNIDTNTKNTFLPFCQHYGIPSNLVDISSSPLNALYFACKEGKGKLDKDEIYINDKFGYVYEFSANHMIPITELIDKLEDDNFLIEISLDNPDFIYDFTRVIYEYERRNLKGFFNLFKQLLNDYKTNTKLENITEVSEYNENSVDIGALTIPGINSFYTMSNDIKWDGLLAEDEIMTQVSEMRPFCDAVYCNTLYYITLLRKHIKFILDYQEYVTYINGMPLFVYDPILSFSRAINQKSVFIYQGFLSYDDDVYDHHVLPLQSLLPDEVIVIKDKDSILNELDYLGINEEFIYNDFDTIAKSIKGKYANRITNKA
jgi:hypothetical protein